MLYFTSYNIAEIHIDLTHQISTLLKSKGIYFKIHELPYREIYRGNCITTIIFYELTDSQKLFLENL